MKGMPIAPGTGIINGGWLTIPHRPMDIDIDTAEPSPCVRNCRF